RELFSAISCPRNRNRGTVLVQAAGSSDACKGGRMLSLLGWLRKTPQSRKTPPRRPAFRPTCEALETRQLPSTATVMSEVLVPRPILSAATPARTALAVDAAPAAIQALAAASTSNLFTVGHRMVLTDPLYAKYFKALTVNPYDPSENALRLEIFNAMRHNPSHRFHFTTLQQARRNFQMRIDMIKFMQKVEGLEASGQ